MSELWFGFVVMVIGMLVVFVGLIVLIAAIQIMSRIITAALESKAAPQGGNA